MQKKNVSGIKDHKIKKGKIITPLNDALGKLLGLQSWSKDRMPEYLWLGLVLMHYGRKNGLEKAGSICYAISREVTSLATPQLSAIFELADEKQIKVFKIIKKNIKPSIISPLTIVYRFKKHPLFNEYFYDPQITVENRIDVIKKAVRIYSPHQSNEATDLRFLALSLLIFGNRLVMKIGMDSTIEALREYAYTDHSDEKMRIYRPTVRSLEGGVKFGESNRLFINYFWREIGMITSCKPNYISFKKDDEDYKDFISDTQNCIENVITSNKELSISDHKFEVIFGSINYALKIFNEVIENNLSDKIVGRHAVRTILEIYIMLKYLLKIEGEKQNVWQEYMQYGISKFKLILLKSREISSDHKFHMDPNLLDILVNEKKLEEFIDIDLRYFDKLNIRDKSIYVDEKELYDLCYDYDSSYSHGLWGAIRESSMLFCDNPAHRGHNIPDIYSKQLLLSINSDCIYIINKCFNLIHNIYSIPEWYLEKYGII